MQYARCVLSFAEVRNLAIRFHNRLLGLSPPKRETYFIKSIIPAVEYLRINEWLVKSIVLWPQRVRMGIGCEERSGNVRKNTKITWKWKTESFEIWKETKEFRKRKANQFNLSLTIYSAGVKKKNCHLHVLIGQRWKEHKSWKEYFCSMWFGKLKMAPVKVNPLLGRNIWLLTLSFIAEGVCKFVWSDMIGSFSSLSLVSFFPKNISFLLH